jgi:hypothetical protein
LLPRKQQASDTEEQMEIHGELQAEEIRELQKMLDTPIEDQAADYGLSWLGIVLRNGIEALQGAENEEETYEALGLITKSAFVIGRRHADRLI